MSIFGSIMHKLGFGGNDNALVEDSSSAKTPDNASVETSAPASVETVKASASVDVPKKMEELAAASKEKLDWKSSIVDFLKLLGVDSSYSHRKELASELGCPADFMHDSAKMNVWLHKQVMIELAKNGGKVPANLV